MMRLLTGGQKTSVLQIQRVQLVAEGNATTHTQLKKNARLRYNNHGVFFPTSGHRRRQIMRKPSTVAPKSSVVRFLTNETGNPA